MKKLFIGSLPPTASEDAVRELFTPFGKIHSFKLAKDLFSGECKGFGFLEMEGHEARAAIAGLNGKSFEGNFIKVNFEIDKSKRGGRRR